MNDLHCQFHRRVMTGCLAMILFLGPMASAVAQSGNVGINIATPLLPLDVRGSSEATGASLQVATPSQQHFLRMFSGNNAVPHPGLLFHVGDTFHIVTATPDLSTFVRRVNILPDGRVGIAAEHPDARLDVFANASMEGGIRGVGSGSGYGMSGIGGSYGVKGYGTSVGVDGFTSESNAIGVAGTSIGNGSTGVEGFTFGEAGIGVNGEAYDDGTLTGIGVRGASHSGFGIGVLGVSMVASGTSTGVSGNATNSSQGTGVRGAGGQYGTWGQAVICGAYGNATANSGTAYGAFGRSQSTSGRGVYGEATATTGTTYGAYGKSQSTSGRGVYGEATATTGTTYGVYGNAPSVNGRGVYGTTSGESGYALYGRATGQYGKGLYAEVTSTHSSANAILAVSGGGSSYAAYLVGRTHVTNDLSVGGNATVSNDMYVTGSLFVTDVPFGDYANLQYNAGTGRFYFDNSSARYKENIRDLEDDFSRILQARPVQYTRPGRPERTEIGYVAEEMADLGLDYLVEIGKDGQVENFNYEKMILYVVEVLKDQDTEIKMLKKEIAELKKR